MGAGSTSYPTNVDENAEVDENTEISSGGYNNHSVQIEAIETKVGVDSSTVNTTLDYFLKHTAGAFRTHLHDGSSDDGANIPEANVVFGASGHDHTGTTAGNLIPTAGIEDAAVTSRKTALTIPKPASNYPKDLTNLTETSNTDLADVTMTFTPDVTSSCSVTFTTDAYTSANGEPADYITFYLLVDDDIKTSTSTNNFVTGNSYQHPIALSYVATGLDASEHTIKIQYKQSGATWSVIDACLQGILIAE